MSSRDVIARERALASTLRSFTDRSRRIQRRARWPGATRSAIASNIPIEVSTGAPPPVWQTALSLNLDPGNWMVLGLGVVDRNLLDQRLAMRVAESMSTEDLSLTGEDALLQSHTPVNVPQGGGTVLLEFFGEVLIGGPTFTTDVLFCSLIAYPL